MTLDPALINAWSSDRWLELKRQLAECVWCEGALLQHELPDRLYFAPEPTEFGIVYEILSSDIVEAISTGQTKTKLDRSYAISRLYLRRNAVLKKIVWLVATDLPSDVSPLREVASSLAVRSESISMLDKAILNSNAIDRVEAPGNVGGGGSGGGGGTRGGGPGNSSGVRG